jgi:hypothetical protein
VIQDLRELDSSPDIKGSVKLLNEGGTAPPAAIISIGFTSTVPKDEVNDEAEWAG